MNRPTKTATKDIIWAYVEGLEAELAAKKEGKFDPKAEKEAAYAKMNELATKSVQASQPVYVNKDNK